MIATKFLGVFILSSIVLIETLVCPGKNTWECSDGICIWYTARCDGIGDCDGSDEQNCGNWTCSSTWLKCDDAMECVWEGRVCDGNTDCNDGSDEQNCGEGMKYGGNLTCPSAWEIGQSVKLTLTIDRSIWPSICKKAHRRQEAWFEVIRWNDMGRQSIECTVYNIMWPGRCQGAFTPGTLGCGCVGKTDEHFTLEFNFVMDVSSFGNWSVDTHCLRTDLSKSIKFHVAPECNVRPEPPPSINPSTSQGGAGGPLTIPRGQTNVTLTCGIEGRTTGVCWCFCPTTSPDLVQKQHPELIFKSNSSLCRPDELWIYCSTNAPQPRSVDSPFVTTYNSTTKRTQLVITETSDLLDGSYRCAFGHKTLTGNISQVSTKFIVAVTGCENMTYGARCQESCGQCANNETCDASTGHCPACPDGLLPPLCKQLDLTFSDRQDEFSNTKETSNSLYTTIGLGIASLLAIPTGVWAAVWFIRKRSTGKQGSTPADLAAKANPHTFQANPHTFHENPDTFHENPDTFHENPDTFHENPDTFHENPDTFHENPDTFHENSDTSDETQNTSDETQDISDETRDISDETQDTSNDSNFDEIEQEISYDSHQEDYNDYIL